MPLSYQRYIISTWFITIDIDVGHPLYEFPVAAKTNFNKFGGLKKIEYLFSHSSEGLNPEINMSRILPSLWRLYDNWLLGSGSCLAFLWHVATLLQSLPPSLYHLPLCLSFLCIRTFVIRYRSHLNNPDRSHLKIFNLIISAKILFPNNNIHRF